MRTKLGCVFHIIPNEQIERVIRTATDNCRVCFRSLEKLTVDNVDENDIVIVSRLVVTRLRTIIEKVD